MKKGILVLAVLCLGVAAWARAETQKGSAVKDLKKDSGTSVEEKAQEVMYQTSADARKDTKDSLAEMKKTNEQKAKQRSAVAKQKAAQAKAKKAMKVKYDEVGVQARGTVVPGARKK